MNVSGLARNTNFLSENEINGSRIWLLARSVIPETTNQDQHGAKGQHPEIIDALATKRVFFEHPAVPRSNELAFNQNNAQLQKEHMEKEIKREVAIV
jgi:hypothetical protein